MHRETVKIIEYDCAKCGAHVRRVSTPQDRHCITCWKCRTLYNGEDGIIMTIKYTKNMEAEE